MPDRGVPPSPPTWFEILIRASEHLIGFPWNARWRTPWSPAAAIRSHHHHQQEVDRFGGNSQYGDPRITADSRTDTRTEVLTTSDGGEGGDKFLHDMPHRSHVTLQNFFVFNPTLGRGEDEEDKKLLFYYPPETDSDDQLRDIGIAQGLVSFTKVFSPHKPCEVLHTQKTRQLFLEAEPDYWIVLTLNLPSQQRTRDSQTVVEYLAEDVQDPVYQAVLHKLYILFRTFNAKLADVMSSHGVDGLRKTLGEHFMTVLPQLKLQHCDILDIFLGVHFLPLDKSAFLQVHSFVGSLEKTFPEVKYTAFLCNDQLVWSGLAQRDMQLLYHYLLSNILQGVFEAELLAPTLSPFKGPPGAFPQARFLHGKTEDPDFIEQVPHMFMGDERYKLLIYRALSATVCLLIEPNDLTTSLARGLEEFLAPELTSLANDISKQYTKLTATVNKGSQDIVCKYIYFNRMNIAQKSSIHAERKLGFNVPSSLLRLIMDLHSDLNLMTIEGDGPNDGEMVAKTSEDWWLVAKSWDSREFYVVLNHKNANLIQISEEVKRLCNSQLQNIFFVD
ncbi:vacuolar fusion protein CCZ1 homolog [Galendromus occidentalis]|uniref:Vacuolar fusion protein CCZ1 homolog n=1 Tax=Galendromus occidentalis TaxID=34638 RepID=A0AAJ6QW87_9ACAR|nr:vacuolar fusion protein CCZ1 homolog [Galendromus occidentalis]